MNISLMQLWMPIILGGVLAWVVSALVHMVLKYHNSDYAQLANEDEVASAIRNGTPSVGFYSFPYCKDMGEMKDPAMQQKMTDGPIGFLAIFPNGMPNMLKFMVQQVAFFIVGCLLIAYCATLALGPGADYLTVFRFVSATGFLAFGWAHIPYSIWYGHPWSTTAKYMLDGLIYGLVVGGTFAWLWP